MSLRRGLSTQSIHAGEAPDPSTGAHGVPIYQNATFGLHSYESVEAWRAGAPHVLYASDQRMLPKGSSRPRRPHWFR